MRTATPVDTFVVDASALAKLVKDEAHREAFRRWHGDAVTAGTRLFAPHLLRYELGNLLARNVQRLPDPSPAAREAVLEQMLVGFQFADGTRPENLAPPLTYYDASYLGLAQSLQATMVTYDEKMLAAAKKAKVKTLSPGA